MYKKFLPILVALALLWCSTAFAQRIVGSIYGVVVDKTDAVLPGVIVTVSGPNLMGVQSFTTTESGMFRFPSLPPGAYTVKAELEGFQTTELTRIIVNAGKSTEAKIEMAIAGVEEVLTVTGESPTVDTKSSKIAMTMSSELLANIPFARDLYDIVNAAPGAVSENVTYRRTSSVHGSTVRDNTYAFDGVNMNDPVVMYPLTNINFDVMDEVEMITGGHPAETGYTMGAYINIVTKSGGDEFHGAGTVYYTNENFKQVLFTQEQLTNMGVSAPEYDTSWFDGSFSLGGPIQKEKLWFFGNARYIKQEIASDFIPWTDPFGNLHDAYDWTHEEKMAFIKVSGQVSEKLRIMGQYNYVLRHRPIYNQPAWNLPKVSTGVWDHETGNTANAIATYVFDPNTFMDIRFGYVRRWFPIPMQPEAQNLPVMVDQGTGHNFGSYRFNETYLRKRLQTGAYLSKFKDDVAGGNHEFKFGFEIEKASGTWDWWRADNLIWWWGNRSPYFYGIEDGVGSSRTFFYICGPTSGSNELTDYANRFGFYAQDTATFGRLTINAGIRLDHTNGWKPAINKAASGNPISIMLGETFVRPEYGFNPYGEMSSPEWKDIMIWNSWSPRVAATYDLTGDGKTALRASFARYTQYMMLQYFSVVSPFYPRSFRFEWYDTNNNQQPDIDDYYVQYPADFRTVDPAFAKNKIDSNTSAPLTDEFIVGVQRELSRDFSIGVNYIYKHNTNIFEDVVYSLDDGRYWNTYESAPEWWVPFTTIVPGTDDYDDVQLTFYARANDAPDIYFRGRIEPDLYRTYQALEITFNKRMSNRWQLAGSIVYSKMSGNIGGNYGSSWGWSGAADDANAWVNAEGMLDFDRPLAIKLFGTYELPKGFLLSGSFRHQSGQAQYRQGYMVPPSNWCAANNAQRDYYFVNVEPLGDIRRRAEDYLDLRLEKQFDLGGGRRLGVYIDAFNVLGWANIIVKEDDVYIWYPAAENTAQGTKSVSNYGQITNTQGIRVIKFSFRFIF